MRDIWKYALRMFGLMVVLNTVMALFAFMIGGGTTTAGLVYATFFLVVYCFVIVVVGIDKGDRDLAYQQGIEHYQQEHDGNLPKEADIQRFYNRNKGLYAGLLAASPSLLFSLGALIFAQNDAVMSFLSPATRLSLAPFLFLFSRLDVAFAGPDTFFHYAYLPMALLYPALCAIGYMQGAKHRDKTLHSVEQAKKGIYKHGKKQKKAKSKWSAYNPFKW